MNKIKQVFNANCKFLHKGWNNACTVFNSSKNGYVNLDVFFEASFEWMHTKDLIEKNCRKYPKEDFIAIIHNPFDTYLFSALSKYTNVKPYPECILELLQNHCKGLYFMCEEQALVFKKYFDSIGLNISCNHLYHPIQNLCINFSLNKFYKNSKKLLIQAGMHLRKVSTPFIIASDFLHSDLKVACVPWEERNQYSLMKEIKQKNLQDIDFDSVKRIKTLTYKKYLTLYESNIFLLDLFDVTCCNVILDCIATNTPIITNRHKATEEYLGADYPLFFENIEEIAKLAKNKDMLYNGSEYLRFMDKNKFSIRNFKYTFLNSEIYQSL